MALTVSLQFFFFLGVGGGGTLKGKNLLPNEEGDRFRLSLRKYILSSPEQNK